MKIVIKGITTLLFVVCLSFLSGCGDDEGLPYHIEALDPVIDLSNPNSTSGTIVAVTLFDTKGNPMTDGTMIFSLSSNTAGYFLDEDGKPVKTLSVKIEDKDVAEVWFQATKKPETVVVSAYCPGYPKDKVVRTSIRIINGTFGADFSYRIDGESLNGTFIDESGFNDNAGQTIDQWTWLIRDETANVVLDTLTLTGRGSFSYGFFTVAGHQCSVRLTILGSDGATSSTIAYFDIPD